MQQTQRETSSARPRKPLVVVRASLNFVKMKTIKTSKYLLFWIVVRVVTHCVRLTKTSSHNWTCEWRKRPGSVLSAKVLPQVRLSSLFCLCTQSTDSPERDARPRARNEPAHHRPRRRNHSAEGGSHSGASRRQDREEAPEEGGRKWSRGDT